jgi:hypothetical protein
VARLRSGGGCAKEAALGLIDQGLQLIYSRLADQIAAIVFGLITVDGIHGSLPLEVNW